MAQAHPNEFDDFCDLLRSVDGAPATDLKAAIRKAKDEYDLVCETFLAMAFVLNDKVLDSAAISRMLSVIEMTHATETQARARRVAGKLLSLVLPVAKMEGGAYEAFENWNVDLKVVERLRFGPPANQLGLHCPEIEAFIAEKTHSLERGEGFAGVWNEDALFCTEVLAPQTPPSKRPRHIECPPAPARVQQKATHKGD